MEGAQTGMRAFRGYGPRQVTRKIEEWHWETPATEGESPVFEIRRERAESEVLRDTWNLVGNRGDHPPRLNTP